MNGFVASELRTWVYAHAGWSLAKKHKRHKMMKAQLKGLLPAPYRNCFTLRVKSGE